MTQQANSSTAEARQAAGAFNQRAHQLLVADVVDEVAFPVARLYAAVDFGRTHMEDDHVGDLATPALGCCTSVLRTPILRRVPQSAFMGFPMLYA